MFMIRKAFVLQVKQDQHEEYRKRHNPIWPELEATLKSHGVHNYSIFLHRETSQLFAYVEIENEAQWERIARTDVCPQRLAHLPYLIPPNHHYLPSPAVLHL